MLLGSAFLGRADEPLQRSRRTPVVEVFERCRDAVVNINTTSVVQYRTLGIDQLFEDIFDYGRPRTRNQAVHSIGSGVVIHRAGYIVTNAHVVAQASDVRVTFASGETLTATIVAVDTEHDLGVLRVESPRPLTAVRLGRSDDIMIGESVVAIGNPLGLQHTVTSGIVSAINRDLQFRTDLVYRGLIQTDTPINPGNSGGPLLNINGELIGINTAIRGDAQNIGFAIPVDRLFELLPSMLDVERRERVRFGVELTGREPRVVSVRSGTPAERAGVRAGDRVVRFNDDPIASGIDFYVHLLAQKPGEQVRLALERGGRSVEARAALEAIPIPDGAALARQRLGATLTTIDPQLQRQIRRAYNLPVGLIVEEVERLGPAARAKLAPGDVILRLDRVPVFTLNDVGLALERVPPGQQVVVDGLRFDADPPFVWTVAIRTNEAPR